MEDIILVNKMEEAVKHVAEEMMVAPNSGVCHCQRCQLDVIALALNSLPPRYVVTNIGNAVTNVDLSSSQWGANITMAVCKAIETVKGRPRHS